MEIQVKALIITGKYAQDIEVFYPLYRMDEEGWKVELATPEGEQVSGVYGMRITPTGKIPYVKRPDSWDVLILPGGARALEYLRQDFKLLTFIAGFHKAGGVIGSICHGTQLLISAGLVKGRRVSGYYSIKDDINNAGGIFVDSEYTVDDRIVSSPHYKYLGPWMKEIIHVTREKHDRF